MHLKSKKYGPKYSAPKIAHSSYLSPSLDSKITEGVGLTKPLFKQS
jgi:hypothetical protein